MNLLDVLTGPWAIQPDKLLEIQAIYAAHARGERADLPAIAARLGRPLDNSQNNRGCQMGGDVEARRADAGEPRLPLRDGGRRHERDRRDAGERDELGG